LEGEKVKKLELEAYEEQGNIVLGGICEDLKKRNGVVDVQIHHLIGDIQSKPHLINCKVPMVHILLS